jgi:hypothetical protein
MTKNLKNDSERRGLLEGKPGRYGLFRAIYMRNFNQSATNGDGVWKQSPIFTRLIVSGVPVQYLIFPYENSLKISPVGAIFHLGFQFKRQEMSG